VGGALMDLPIAIRILKKSSRPSEENGKKVRKKSGIPSVRIVPIS